MKSFLSDFDVFFLSYDEPNAEKHWADLYAKVPWAKRIHGVKGFDSAHKAAAEKSDTDYLITIDADNIIDPKFFDEEIDLPDRQDPFRNFVYSWNGKNLVNGLCYGNGGIKLWPKEVILDLKSHENAERDEDKVDFCWNLNYVQMSNSYSTVDIAGSPYQAWRSGFREGVKMTLDRGKRMDSQEFIKQIHPLNLRRLKIWLSVGADTENGIWAIYGARLGAYLNLFIPESDHTRIADFDKLEAIWVDDIEGQITAEQLPEKMHRYELGLGRIGLHAPLLSAEASAFFKEIQIDPGEKELLFREADYLKEIK